MKILVYSMNFMPELAGIGKYSGEMAEWLHARGHEVRVIASPPFFPQWSVFEGHSARAWRTTDWNGIRIFRSPTFVPAKPRALGRLAHLLSFTLSSIPVLLAQVRWKPDVVFVVEPPVSCAPAALCFSKLLGIRSWLHIQDYEVDAAFDLGWLRGERVRRFAQAAERWLMRRFDRVSSISSTMCAKAREKGVAPERLVMFPNWVDIQAIQPVVRPHMAEAVPTQGYRAELNIPAKAVVVLYAGSLGSKQGIELLAEAAGLLVCSHDIHFVFCGNGPTRASLMEACARLPNAHFLDLQPAERLNELLGMADIHVLPQRADAADLVMPSKLGGMFASGRSVIVTAHAATALGEAVQGRGVVVEPGDAAALADAIEQLSMSPSTRELLGAAGRRFAESELDRNVILQRLEEELQRCIAR